MSINHSSFRTVKIKSRMHLFQFANSNFWHPFNYVNFVIKNNLLSRLANSNYPRLHMATCWPTVQQLLSIPITNKTLGCRAARALTKPFDYFGSHTLNINQLELWSQTDGHTEKNWSKCWIIRSIEDGRHDIPGDLTSPMRQIITGMLSRSEAINSISSLSNLDKCDSLEAHNILTQNGSFE